MKKAILSVLLLPALALGQTNGSDELDVLNMQGQKVGTAVSSWVDWRGTTYNSIRANWTSFAVPQSNRAKVAWLIGVGAPTGPFLDPQFITAWDFAETQRSLGSGINPGMWNFALRVDGLAALPRGFSCYMQPVWLDNVQVGWDTPVQIKL